MSLWETQTRRRIESALLTLGRLSLSGLVDSCHQSSDLGFDVIVGRMVIGGSIGRNLIDGELSYVAV